MKKNLPLILVILIICSCKKDQLSVPVEFTATYQTLGTFDSSGRPDYLTTPDTISANLRAFSKGILIEKSDLRTAHPELLSANTIADLQVAQASDVYVTYVSQVTTSSNAIAFYTYPTNARPSGAKDVKTITYIFPSAGTGTKLKSGDKVKIGRFEAGTSIGFILMKNAWNSATRSLDSKAVHFCSDDVLNPEVDLQLKKHAVVINYAAESKVLIGFENTDRSTDACDHDFNDVVIYATVTP